LTAIERSVDPYL
jgi:hypothetical protein